MTWTQEEALADQAHDRHTFPVAMTCVECRLITDVLFDDRTEEPVDAAELDCPECGARMVEE